MDARGPAVVPQSLRLFSLPSGPRLSAPLSWMLTLPVSKMRKWSQAQGYVPGCPSQSLGEHLKSTNGWAPHTPALLSQKAVQLGRSGTDRASIECEFRRWFQSIQSRDHCWKTSGASLLQECFQAWAFCGMYISPTEQAVSVSLEPGNWFQDCAVPLIQTL